MANVDVSVIAALRASLASSKVAIQNNALYQTISGLISASTTIGSHSNDNENGLVSAVTIINNEIAAIQGSQIIAETTFASLPVSPFIGQLANISDGSVNTWGSNCVGAGTNKVLIRWNGTAWTVVGK